jgi:hypothetical protein
MSVETGTFESPMARRARVQQDRRTAALKHLGVKAEPQGDDTWRVTLGGGVCAFAYDQAGFARLYEMLRGSLNKLTHLAAMSVDPGLIGRNIIPNTLSLRLADGRGVLLFRAAKPVVGRTVDAHLRVVGDGEIVSGSFLGEVEALAALPQPLRGVAYPDER